VLLNRGDGTFPRDVFHELNDGTSFPGDFAQMITTADVDADGSRDLAVANYFGNGASVLLNDGLGQLGPVTKFSVGSAPEAIAARDWNADGRSDLLVANSNDDSVSVLLNQGSSGFAAALTLPVGDQPAALVAGDFEADGQLDIAVARRSGGVGVGRQGRIGLKYLGS